MFTHEHGSFLHPGKFSDLFERLTEAVGLPPIHLHDLRHVAATLMLAAGVGIKAVSETLGHSDTRITRGIYQSVLDDLARDAAEKVVQLVPMRVRRWRLFRTSCRRPTSRLACRGWCCRARTTPHSRIVPPN
ncbi:tyrosine-type recombinase/integrase [Streptomyces californicus]|uniref:tyrosine-type recombinase/integrase n=1 Tax=Streptomyces californicus TaxID=67351 RepID=UPI00378E8112